MRTFGRTHRREGERGATMVEAAIFFPLLFGLLFALIVGGLYFGTRVSAGWAAESAARAGAVSGADGFADYDILQAVKEASVMLNPDAVQLVVVYRAADFGGSPTPGCQAGIPSTGSGIGDCNVYTGADLNRPSTDFGSGGWRKDDYYPATSRSENGYAGTDFLGVWIKAKCSCGAAALGLNDDVNVSSVVRLEAKTV